MPCGRLYCRECESIVDEHVSDTPRDYPTFNRDRLRKFINLLYNYELEWHERQSLIDLFPAMQQHFLKGNRHNFFNMSALALEMSQLLGFEKASLQFKRMINSEKQENIKLFVQDSVKPVVCTSTPYPSLQELEYLEPNPQPDSNSTAKMPSCFFRVYNDIQGDGDKKRLPMQRQKPGPKPRAPKTLHAVRPKSRIHLRPKAKPT
jgi:hypothetical protein